MNKMQLLLLSLIVGFVGFGMARIVANSLDKPSQKDNPTPIQVGVMSERQKEHSKLFLEYSTGRSLEIPLKPLRPKKSKKEVIEETVYIEPGTPVVSLYDSALSFQDFLRKLSCEADAIVIAISQYRVSQLTENKEFIFSDYTAVVEEIFKNNQVNNIGLNENIVLTRPGGKISIGKRVITAIDASYKNLEEGNRYLLFLKYVSSTGAYKSIPKGTFLLTEKDLVPLTEEFIPRDNNGKRGFDSETRYTLLLGCNK